MVEKVAKVRALRETFVEELGGMYEAEEIGVDLPSETAQQKQEIIQQDEPIEGDTTSADNVVNIDEI